jgi:hypothetical protein
MSTSSKDPRTIRQGGPGASHENANDPPDPKKPGAEPKDRRDVSHVSSGGGEQDKRSSRDEKFK